METTATCKYYEVELEPFRKPGFHYTFQQSVQRMKSDLANGGELSDAKLLELFQLFGTHYVTSAMCGSRYTNIFTLTPYLRTYGASPRMKLCSAYTA